MTYADEVTAAAAALTAGEAANWELARLTHENTRDGPGRPKPGDERVTMKQWCADVSREAGSRSRFSATTGMLFKAAWVRFGNPSDSEGFPLFADVIRDLNGDPPPTRPRATAPRAPRAPAPAKPYTDQEARRLIRAAADQQGVGRPARVQPAAPKLELKEPNENPLVQRLDATQVLFELSQAMDAFVASIVLLWPRVRGIPRPDNDFWGQNYFLRGSHAKAQGALDQIASLLRTGSPTGDLDNFVQRVLKGTPGEGES